MISRFYPLLIDQTHSLLALLTDYCGGVLIFFSANRIMKTIALILSLLLLTSCSNPVISGGVTLIRSGGESLERHGGAHWCGPGGCDYHLRCERQRDDACMNRSNDGKRYVVASPPPPPPRTASFFSFMSGMRWGRVGAVQIKTPALRGG